MRYFAGFDCGGTSTRCALVNEKGELLGIGKGGPSNYLSCGRDTAEESLRNALSNAFSSAGVLQEKPSFVYIASAAVEVGQGDSHKPFFEKIFGDDFECTADISPLRYSAPGDGPALCIIAGTGAVVYALYDTHFVKASGWGPLLGDEGSGYDVGLKALRLAIRMMDGREKEDPDFLNTVLISKGVDPVKRKGLYSAVHNGDIRSNVAATTFAVTELFRKGNKTAIRLLNEAAEELELSVRAVLSRTEPEIFPAVLSGSTLKEGEPVYELLRSKLLQNPRISGVFTPKVSPAVTCAAIALKKNGLPEAAERLLKDCENESHIRAGWARKEILPTESVRLAGFDYRKAKSTGVLDPIYVSVCSLSQSDGNRLLFASFDLLGVSSYLCEDLRAEILSLGFSDDSIFLFATHTHAAPGSAFRGLDYYDENYYNLLKNVFRQTVLEAMNDEKPAFAHFQSGKVPNVASVRDLGRARSSYEMPIMNLLFERESGGDVLFCNYACHPTVFDEKNTFISRDLVGGCEKIIGKQYHTLYLNGACGNLSARYTKTSATDEERNRLGKLWAQEILALLENKGKKTDVSFRSHAEKIFIPPAEYFDEEKRKSYRSYLEQKIQVCKDDSEKREYLSCLAVINRTSYGRFKGDYIRVSVTDMGEFLFLSLPFEVSTQEAHDYTDMLEVFCKKKVFLICYSGGYDGYLPSGRPLDFDSSYEDLEASYTFRAKFIVREAIMKCAQNIMSEE